MNNVAITSFVHSDEFAVILKKYFSPSTVFKALPLCSQSFIIKNKIKNKIKIQEVLYRET